jgi:putative spermidine/putrescine transport system substrate-binding protein
MKKFLILTTALTGIASVASAADVTVMSWGGAYTTSQVEAYQKPFTAQTGINVISVDADNPAPAVKAQVEAGNVTTDVADVEYADAIRLCDEGLLETIDPASLPAAPDGTPAVDDFLPGALTDCAVATIVFSTVFAYDTTKFPEGPTTIADFFDLEKFPGKRAMRKGAKANLEMALMADGVPAADVYATLATPEGVDRAFKMLDKIKKDTVWWEGQTVPDRLGWSGLRVRPVRRAERRTEQGCGNGVREVLDRHAASGRPGQVDRLWSGPQVVLGSCRQVQRRQDRHGALHADQPGQHEERSGVFL